MPVPDIDSDWLMLRPLESHAPIAPDAPADSASPASAHPADAVYCPFRIVVDCNEQAPFSFLSLHTTARTPRQPLLLARGSTPGRPLIVATVEKPLWAMGRSTHGAGLADYSIDGLEEEIQVETKHSLGDLFGSIGQRRRNFEAEIRSLDSRCKHAAVVVTGTWGEVLRYVPPSGHREEASRRMSPQSVRGTVLAWQQRYPKVHWHWAATRVEAEFLTFEILERYWRDRQGRGEVSK